MRRRARPPSPGDCDRIGSTPEGVHAPLSRRSATPSLRTARTDGHTSEATRGDHDDAYTFGIEEEYFLVDAANQAGHARHARRPFLEAAKEATNGQVMGEFLQSQIEVATLPHHDIRTAHAELRHLRQTVAKIAAEHGLAISPPARIRPPTGAGRSKPRANATTR